MVPTTRPGPTATPVYCTIVVVSSIRPDALVGAHATRRDFAATSGGPRRWRGRLSSRSRATAENPRHGAGGRWGGGRARCGWPEGALGDDGADAGVGADCAEGAGCALWALVSTGLRGRGGLGRLHVGGAPSAEQAPATPRWPHSPPSARSPPSWRRPRHQRSPLCTSPSPAARRRARRGLGADGARPQRPARRRRPAARPRPRGARGALAAADHRVGHARDQHGCGGAGHGPDRRLRTHRDHSFVVRRPGPLLGDHREHESDEDAPDGDEFSCDGRPPPTAMAPSAAHR